jgi:hypothetical protein
LRLQAAKAAAPYCHSKQPTDDVAAILTRKAPPGVNKTCAGQDAVWRWGTASFASPLANHGRAAVDGRQSESKLGDPLGRTSSSWILRPRASMTRPCNMSISMSPSQFGRLVEIGHLFPIGVGRGKEDAKSMEVILHEAIGAKIVNIQQQN